MIIYELCRGCNDEIQDCQRIECLSCYKHAYGNIRKKLFLLFKDCYTFVTMNHTDQLGRLVSIPFSPKRIISLVPSQTELLFDFGLDEEVTGITKFCIHPKEKFKTKAKVGGTKKLDLEKIRQLKPDLIIGNKEENEKGQIEQLMQEFPVWMSDINDLDDALDMIRRIGLVVNKIAESGQIAKEIEIGFKFLQSEMGDHTLKTPSVAYFIWKYPYMVAGNHTFINDMMQRAGWKNACELERYPEWSIDDIRNASPDVILLSSEPYPFKEKHIKEFKNICPQAKVIIADGELFSWYGSRLLKTPGYLQSLNRHLII